MKIAYFEKSLLDHLGEAARKSFELIGLSNKNIRQMMSPAGEMVSLIEVADEALFDSAKCTAILTPDQANAKLTELFKPEFSISNEPIFNASLNAKIADGTIKLDSLDDTRPITSQLHWLKLQGVKGIVESQPPMLF